MTWNELKAHIEVMDKEQQETDITVFCSDSYEFFKVKDINFTVGDAVLNDNHPFLEIDC